MKAAVALPAPQRADLDELVLPHSIEAERATLGAALLNPIAADYVVDHLSPAAYFRRAHQTLFEAIRKLRERRSAVDFLTLKTELDRMKRLDDIGGPTYIASLTDGVPHSLNVAHYTAIILDLQAKRALIDHGRRTIDLVASGSHSATAILNDADRRLMDLQAGHVEGRMRSVADSVKSVSDDIEWRMSHRGELTGVPTGYESINEITLGWQPADLIIVGARPSIGKTTFVLNSAVHAAQTFARDGGAHRIAVFSLEMRRRQLEFRILAQLAQVPLTRILNGALGDPELAKMSEAMLTLADLGIEIDDRTGQSIWDVRAACRRLKAEKGLDAAIVDYIQLMPGTLDRKGATRNDEVDDIARRFKDLGDELGIPLLVLSQLNRRNQERSDPRPKLSDLRESGALEQHADMVCFLHRKNHREGGTTEFIIEKQRNGPTGTVNLTLDRDVVTFTDGGEPVQEPEPKAEGEKKTRRRRSS